VITKIISTSFALYQVMNTLQYCGENFFFQPVKLNEVFDQHLDVISIPYHNASFFATTHHNAQVA
jgi:hypothetical protein